MFGAWTAYIVLVLLWERVLGTRLAEWQYVLMNFMGAGAFWVNHYFQKAPLWPTMLNTYTVVFLLVWWWVGVRGQPRSMWWKFGATLGAVAYTVAFIGFEQLARLGVEHYRVNEFWFMAASFAGFIGVILWRGKEKPATPGRSR